MNKKNKTTSLNWDEFRALGNPDNVPEEKEDKKDMNKLLIKQSIRVCLEKKGRGGKSVSIVTGLRMPKTDLEQFAKDLKKICGVGGSVKNSEIIIQGEKRDVIVNYFKEKGVRDIKKSGG